LEVESVVINHLDGTVNNFKKGDGFMLKTIESIEINEKLLQIKLKLEKNEFLVFPMSSMISYSYFKEPLRPQIESIQL